VPTPTPTPVPFQNVSLGAIKDSTIYQENVTLSNGKGDYFFAGKTNSDSIRRGLIAFDLSSIPAGSTIVNVGLRLTMSGTQAGVTTVSLHRLNSNWTEGLSHASEDEGGGAVAFNGDATWQYNSFPLSTWQTLGGDFAAAASASAQVGGGSSVVSWSSSQMVADVQAWLDNQGLNFGWILRGDEDIQSTKRFDSRENSVAGNRPVLIVAYIPPT
jgi:hypothetical protein